MESQMPRPTDPQVVEGEDEHHHEKKSVLTKVKDRAKKIKDTLTKHSHGQEHVDDQDDEDEAMVEDPEINPGAPIHESTPGQELGQSRANLEKPQVHEEDRTDHGQPPRDKLEEDPHTPKDRRGGVSHPSNHQTKVVDPTDRVNESTVVRKGVPGQELGQSRADLEKPTTSMEEDRYSGKITEPPSKPPFGAYGGQVHEEQEDRTDDGQPSAKIGRETELEKPTSMEEDKITEPPSSPPFGAYGSQVHKEQEEDRTDDGQPRVKIGRETELEKPTSMEEDKTIESPSTPRFGAYGSQVHEEEQEDRTDDGQPRVKIGRETELEKPTSMEEDKIIEPPSKPPFGSYGGHEVQEDRTDHGQPRVKLGRETELDEDRPHTPKDQRGGVSDPSNYQTKVVDPTDRGGEGGGIAPIIQSFDKMNVHDEPEPEPKTKSGPEQSKYTGTHDQLSPENPQSLPKSSDSGKPEEMPRDTVTGKPSSQSYTEMITSATSAIAGTAISVKNVAASKLGYGGKEGTQEKHEEGDTLMKGYGGKEGTQEKHEEGDTSKPTLAATVYEKVAGVGSTVMSKVQGTGAEQEKKESGPTTKGPDKGVSVKDYLAEKFRPSEEHRALSNVITDTYHKQKEVESEEEGGGESKPMGKVTESEEVKRRLGTESKHDSMSGEGAEEVVVSGETTPGKGVVDKLKGAVGSWFGKTNESPSSQTSVDAAHAGKQGDGGRGQEAEGEGRLQESSN